MADSWESLPHSGPVSTVIPYTGQKDSSIPISIPSPSSYALAFPNTPSIKQPKENNIPKNGHRKHSPRSRFRHCDSILVYQGKTKPRSKLKRKNSIADLNLFTSQPQQSTDEPEIEKNPTSVLESSVPPSPPSLSPSSSVSVVTRSDSEWMDRVGGFFSGQLLVIVPCSVI